MARHPHADLIKAWAEDTSRVVQYRDPTDVYDWNDIERPAWRPDMEYRFKPEPKQDVVRYCTACVSIGFAEKPDHTNLKLTFSGENGRLISAEVIE